MVSVERLTELEKAATSGPWELNADLPFVYGPDGETITEYALHEDAGLIVALRNAAPELLAVVEAARRVSWLSNNAIPGEREWENADEEAHEDLDEALRALDVTGGDDGEAAV